MLRLMAQLSRFLLDRWLLAALLVSVLMLAIAHAFETFGGLAPCILCLQQRTVYWVAIGLAAVGLFLHWLPAKTRFDRAFSAILAAVFLVGMGIAIRHAGAEWKWWPGPAACAANRVTVTVADLNAALNGGRLKMPSCEEAAWRFLGISMAGWNALISLKLAFWSAVAATGWKPKP